MSKKIIIIFIIIIVSGLSYLIYQLNFFKSTSSFLDELKGEIVYEHRDGNFKNIYKIDANGKNKKLLYHNSDINEYNNQNSMFPMWSEDGSKIYFIAMKDGEWNKFIMDLNGNNVSILGNFNIDEIVSRDSRETDISVKTGSIHISGGKIYSFKFYDIDLNPGASEVSWSPDKNFVVFQSCSFIGGCKIMIANKEGTKVVKITSGSKPDWKY